MFNRRTFVIIKRELKSRLLSKAFILMTILMPVFLFGLIGFQTIMYTRDSDANTALKIVAGSSDLKNRLEQGFANLEIVKSNYYSITFDTLGGIPDTAYVNANKKSVLDEKLTGIFIIPDKAIEDKTIYYYASNPNNQTIFGKVRSTINEVLTDIFFKNKSLTAEEKKFVRRNVEIETNRVRESKIEAEGAGNIVLSFLFTFFLYMSLLLIGANLMRSVVEEKANKIVEVILSSVNPKELMVGKILGTSITGVIQMTIWLIPIIVLLTTSWFQLPEEIKLKIDLWIVAYFLVNYLVALVTYLGLFAAVGAMFDNDQDAQSGIWPIMILIMIPFFIAMGMIQRGDFDFSRIGSMLPFLSLIVMPARLTITNVPIWQIALSAVVNIGTMLILFPVAGKIYRVGILMTGKKPTYADVAKWLKYKY